MSIEIKIEKGIPIPPKKSGGKFFWITKYNEMDVGDSFFVPMTMSRRSNANWCARRGGYKITTRSEVNKEGIKGFRVWLVSKPTEKDSRSRIIEQDPVEGWWPMTDEQIESLKNREFPVGGKRIK